MTSAIFFLLASLIGTFHPTGLQAPRVEDFAVIDAPTWPVTFYFENRQESLAISLFDDDGIDRESLGALSHHVRCFRTDKERRIHPRLAEIVARVSEAFGRDHVDVVSGYRARPYGAPHSKHFLGRAMDLHFPGVPSRKVAAWVWKNFRGIGVGLYPKQDFVHVDVRDLDVRWVDTSLHGESAHAHYFGRIGIEPVPKDAPRLAYDDARLHRLIPVPLPNRSRLAAVGYRGAE